LIAKNKDVWVSTNFGVSVLDANTYTFKNYTINDGLQNNEFNGKAGYQDNFENFYFGGSLSSSYASVNSGKVASVNLNVSDKIWYANFTGTIRNAEDTKIPGGVLENSGFNDNSLSFSAGVLPYDNVELKANYQKFTADDVGIPGGEPFPNSAKATYLFAGREMLSGELIFKQLSSSLNNLKMKYYTQIINREVEVIPNPNVVIEPQAEHKTNGLVLQTDWTFAKNNFLVAGIDLWERSYVGERSKTINSKNQIIIDKPIPDSRFGNLGLFAKDELHLMQNRFKLNFGARYDFIKVTNEETNNPVTIITNGIETVPPANPDASYPASEVNNSSWSGNVGLLYLLFKDVSLTFNTAYTFRSPSLEERYQYIDLGSTVYYGNTNLEPEKGLFFDLGIRVWEDNFSFTADGFVNLFANLVVDEQISDSSYQKNNVGKAKLIGFDGKLEYNFYKSHVLYSSLAYVNGMDTENNEYLPQIPPLNGALGLKLSFKKYVDVDLSATFYDEQNKISSNESVNEGYVYFDIAFNSYPINISLINIQIFAGVNNIFDTSYISHLSTYRGINLTEPGRNIYAKIKLAW